MAVAMQFTVPDSQWSIMDLTDLIGLHIRLDAGSNVIEDAGVVVSVDFDEEPDYAKVVLEINPDEIWNLFNIEPDQELKILGESAPDYQREYE